MVDAIVTTFADAKIILSQSAVSELKVSRDVALCGGSSLYWEITRFYTVCGLNNNPLVKSLRELIQNESESIRLAKVSILDSVSSIDSDNAVSISTIDSTGDISSYPISDDSRSIDAEGTGSVAPSPAVSLLIPKPEAIK